MANSAENRPINEQILGKSLAKDNMLGRGCWLFMVSTGGMLSSQIIF
ncbi:hypothetical protein KT99_11068 [Shewanella benthica KT99]|uniref:Uncharacterized protein n=1 Tax=Shewanella benthica KT99 TaxID=314608 RepID=A9DC44_9GAMM|nr:hypothetical protein KT99_11068 [Shewanella benthica KT99]